MPSPTRALAALAGAVALAGASAQAALGSSYVTDVGSTPGLVSHWRLNETTGTVAADARAANPGTYAGGYVLGSAGLIPSDSSNRAVDFNGSTGRVNVADSASLDVTGALSIEAWIRPDALTGGDNLYTVLRKESAYMLRAEGTTLVFRLTIAGASQELRVASAIAAGTAYHVVATYDGATMRLYRNGAQIGSRAQTGAIGVSATAVGIASYPGGGSHFNGVVDEVALYNQALAADVVARHYSSATCTPAFGGFGGTTWPPACWRAYSSGSVFNTKIPAGAATWSASSAVVGWFNAQGSGPLDWPLGYNGYTAPTYYGRATDPLYTLQRDPSSLDYGPTNQDGAQVRAPVGLRPSTDPDDKLMAIVDQTTGKVHDFWHVVSVNDTSRVITFKWGGAYPVDGSGIGAADAYAFESGFGTQYGYIRYAELQAGSIEHALHLIAPRVLKRLEPAIDTGGNFGGDDNLADALTPPPMGARLQLTLTDAQIDAVTLGGQPAPWYYKVILRAAARYGIFVSDEGDSPWGGLRVESGLQYERLGQQNVWTKFAQEQGIAATSGGFGTYPYLKFSQLKDGTGQSVWRNLRVVAPSAYGYSNTLR